MRAGFLLHRNACPNPPTTRIALPLRATPPSLRARSAQGISAAFVLLAMMLPLGLIAFAPAGPYAVEAGLRAALAAAHLRQSHRPSC
jgi:hypothetical protein